MKIDRGYWRDWEVWVQDTDGIRLPEYQIKHIPGETDVVKLYIECKENRDFEIVFKRPTYLSVDCHISSTIDGRGTYTEAFLKKYTCKHVHQLPETIDNGKYWRTLRFKNIKRNENSPLLSDMTLKELGSINVLLECGIFVPGECAIISFDSPPVAAVMQGLKIGKVSTLVGGELVARVMPEQLHNFTKDSLAPNCEVRFMYGTRDYLDKIMAPEDRVPDLANESNPTIPATDLSIDELPGSDNDQNLDIDRKPNIFETAGTSPRPTSENVVAGPSNSDRIANRTRETTTSSDNDDGNDVTAIEPLAKKTKTDIVDLTQDDEQAIMDDEQPKDDEQPTKDNDKRTEHDKQHPKDEDKPNSTCNCM